MNARYDDVIVALMNNEFDQAIGLIEKIKEQNPITMGSHKDSEAFSLQPDEASDFERTTDFLPFYGWESA